MASHKLIDVTTDTSATINSAEFNPSRTSDESGVCQTYKQAGTLAVQMQGKVRADAPWVDLMSSADTATGITGDVPVLPHMRCQVTDTGGGSTSKTVAVWFME